MKTRQVVLAGMLLSIAIGCRDSGDAHEKTETKPPSQGALVKPATAIPAQDTTAQALKAAPILILDSTVASIQFKREEDGYRFFLQPKDRHARMESRCAWWTLDSIPGSKEISYLDHQESNCNSQFLKFEGLTAAIRWVEKDSNTIVKKHGREYLYWFSLAKNPILLLESIDYQERFHRFIEIPLGETIATLTFHSDDACETLIDSDTGCEESVLPPPTVGDVRLKIKINIKEGQFEIQPWP